jgi:energy-coupling factor transporter ATP-binding protein EcfA2
MNILNENNKIRLKDESLNGNNNIQSGVYANDTTEDFIQLMIDEGFYRQMKDNGALVMFNGEKSIPFQNFVKIYQLITGYKNGRPEYLDLYAIDRKREDFPIITKTIYDINKPFGKVDSEAVFNTAKQLDIHFPVESIDHELDTSIFWNHLEYLCGDVDQETKEWVKDWLADIFQNPNKKKGTALVFIGCPGCGKSIFWNTLMSALLGEYFHHADEKLYASKFNLELANKLLINFNEGFASKSKLAEAKLKSFITESTFKNEGKGSNSTTIFNPARAVFTTNSRHALNVEHNDRRFAIFQTIKQDFITDEYFDDFAKAVENKEMLEQFMFELMNREITSRLNITPKTEAKESQKVFSADKVSEWFNFIMETERYYLVDKNDNFSHLWLDDFKENERVIDKDRALETYIKFKGDNDGIITTNKLFTALKVLLESNDEWRIFNETKRGGIGFKLDKPKRLWVLRKKVTL